jgi:hypothetical protein
MMQEYRRLLGIRADDEELQDLGATIGALSDDHPIAAVTNRGKDFRRPDALLHPQDRAYTVPQIYRVARSIRLLLRAMVRAGDLSAAMRSDRRPAALRVSPLAAAAETARRGRTLARNHDPAQFHGLSRRPCRREPTDHVRWRRLAELRSVASAMDSLQRLPSGVAAVLINQVPGRRGRFYANGFGGARPHPASFAGHLLPGAEGAR